MRFELFVLGLELGVCCCERAELVGFIDVGEVVGVLGFLDFSYTCGSVGAAGE